MYLTRAVPSDNLSTRPVHSMAEYVHPRFVMMHAHALECEYSPCLFQSQLSNARKLLRSLLSEGRAQ
jgi:hypothetical protein